MKRYNALNKQYLLIQSYRYWIKKSDGEKARQLLETAKIKGYCEPDQELSGNKLRSWVKNERGPIWAYKAAVELLLETEYQPRTKEEIEVLALVISSIGKEKSALSKELQQNQALCDLVYTKG